MEPFLGQIQPFGFNFNPRGWLRCEGQLLSISQNSALFSLLGTIYGGDGRTTFGIPDLRGRVPVGFGNGPGLSNYNIGTKGGVETVVLNTLQMPSHNHTGTASVSQACSSQPGDEDSPEGHVPAAHAGDEDFASVPDSTMAAATATVAISNNGGNQAHENRPPYLAINWSIALTGLFPSRN